MLGYTTVLTARDKRSCPVSNILSFPNRTANAHTIERYMTQQECVALSSSDPFGSWTSTLDSWFEEHSNNALNKRHSELRSLLADTWLIFHMACDQTSKLKMLQQHNLRWAHLQYYNLSDFELIIIVSDNLADLSRRLHDLFQEFPPLSQNDLHLHCLIQGINRLNKKLDHLFSSDGNVIQQPEWTS